MASEIQTINITDVLTVQKPSRHIAYTVQGELQRLLSDPCRDWEVCASRVQHLNGQAVAVFVLSVNGPVTRVQQASPTSEAWCRVRPGRIDCVPTWTSCYPRVAYS